MPLFRVDLATIEGLDEEGEVVVHEGDGPKALAKAALRHYREQRQVGCAADGSGANVSRRILCPLHGFDWNGPRRVWCTRQSRRAAEWSSSWRKVRWRVCDRHSARDQAESGVALQ